MREQPSKPTATPSDFPVQSPAQNLPGADYSYTVELVGTINHSVGKLIEAVETLKSQSKIHGEKIDAIGKDVHAAKVVISVVGGLILFVGGIIAWLVNTYISTHPVR